MKKNTSFKEAFGRDYEGLGLKGETGAMQQVKLRKKTRLAITTAIIIVSSILFAIHPSKNFSLILPGLIVATLIGGGFLKASGSRHLGRFFGVMIGSFGVSAAWAVMRADAGDFNAFFELKTVFLLAAAILSVIFLFTFKKNK